MTAKAVKILACVSILALCAAAPALAAEKAGSAATPAPKAAATTTAPDVTVLASPYTWSASKSADGTVSLEGHVPSADTRQSILDGIGKLGSDTMAVASGEPSGFVGNAVAALDILATLDSGSVGFDGASWSVTGAVDSADKLKAAQDAFAASPLEALGATLKLSGPAAEASATPTPAASSPPALSPSAVDPAYAWSAAKAADGSLTFTGAVPNDKLKKFLAGHVAGATVTDNSTVAGGAPASFVGGALYGLDALSDLESGQLSFANGAWTLGGKAKDQTAIQSAKAALGSVDVSGWTFDLSVSAAPAAAAPPAATQPVAAAVSDYAFKVAKAADGTVSLDGDVPTEGARGYFADMAGKTASNNLAVKPQPPADFVANALGGIDALAQLSQGELDFAAGKWSLRGKAPTPEAQQAVIASLGKLPAAKEFVAADIVGPTPLEQCQAQLAAFVSSGGKVNFDGRGTKFVKGTDAQLDKVAAALALCPEVRVNIEGNTDSDGPADANMALSVARSEAVVGALVKRGIAVSRLYAVGYGETLPLVPNTTRANKAKNRRINFVLVP